MSITYTNTLCFIVRHDSRDEVCNHLLAVSGCLSPYHAVNPNTISIASLAIAFVHASSSGPPRHHLSTNPSQTTHELLNHSQRMYDISKRRAMHLNSAAALTACRVRQSLSPEEAAQCDTLIEQETSTAGMLQKELDETVSKYHSDHVHSSAPMLYPNSAYARKTTEERAFQHAARHGPPFSAATQRFLDDLR